jgi:hypothetical protein
LVTSSRSIFGARLVAGPGQGNPCWRRGKVLLAGCASVLGPREANGEASDRRDRSKAFASTALLVATDGGAKSHDLLVLFLCINMPTLHQRHHSYRGLTPSRIPFLITTPIKDHASERCPTAGESLLRPRP